MKKKNLIYLLLALTFFTKCFCAYLDITDITDITSQSFATLGKAVGWSSDGRYLASGGEDGTTDLKISSFDGTSLQIITQENMTTTINAVSWDPIYGQYLAIANDQIPAAWAEFIIYSFNGKSLTLKDSESLATSVESVDWRPNGSQYIAMCGDNGGTNDIRMYVFDGTSLTLKDQESSGYIARSLNWSPDSNYLAAGGQSAVTTGVLKVYSATYLTLTEVTSINLGSAVYSVSWSPDGQYLAVGSDQASNQLRIYSFNGTTLTPVYSISLLNYIASIKWSGDGKYLIAAKNNGASSQLELYSFDGSALTAIFSKTISVPYSVDWTSDNKYIALAHDAGGEDVQVFFANRYQFTNSTNTISNNIYFQETLFVFTQQYLTGAVTLLGGLNIAANAQVNLDLKYPVYQGITLNSTGRMNLFNNLHTAQNFTINDTGFIYCYGYSMITDGDLIVNNNVDLKFKENGIIDGQCHKLTLGSNTKILVDTSNTFTLKNLTLEPSINSTLPSVNTSYYGKLFLDNVKLHNNDNFYFYRNKSQGEINLVSDLHLAQNFNFYQGGSISGKGNSIVLDGDITIADGVELFFTSDTIIDGQGHNLTLGHRAQLLIDTLTTLTLKNLTLNNTLNTISQPAVKCLDWYGKLALDNVELTLNNEFSFYNGQMFIHNDVIFSGTSQFTYRSVQPSYITAHSTLNFDKGTSFKYYPSTPDKTLIKMNNETSKLYFDGCTLKSTFTGLQLTTGSVYFDNKVNVTSAETQNISSTPFDSTVGSDSTEESPQSCSWSPNGQFIAVANYLAQTIEVFSYSGSGNPQQVTSYSTPFEQPNSVNWSPNGKFIAVTYCEGQKLEVLSFSNDGSLTSVGSITTFSKFARYVDWSPNGNFIAVVSPNELRIYSFSGIGNPSTVGTVASGSTPYSVNWSPDGKFLAVVNSVSNTIQIFSFSGSGDPLLVGQTTTESSPRSVNWSPDGNFLAVVNYTSNTLQTFSFSGSGNPAVIGSATTGTDPFSVKWSPDGRFMAVVGYSSATLQIFSFSESGNPSSVGTASTSPGPYSVSWSRNEDFVAVVNETSSTLEIFTVNYTHASETQATSNSIVFQDLVNGIEPDASVHVLGGTNIILDGLMHL